MAKFQLVTCHVALGGDRGSVIVRDRQRPFTYPEYLLMKVLHGGDEFVTNALSVGYDDRDPVTEYDRMAGTYGEDLLAAVFPGKHLPLGNEALMTEEEFQAGELAAVKARSAVRGKKPTAKVELPTGADTLTDA